MTSSATAAVVNVNDAPGGSVTISGTATEDQKLTASHTITDEDGMPNSVSYQWKRGGSAISGATDVSYTLVQDDVGAAMTVTVSYTDDQDTSESMTSSATAAVVNVNDAPGGSVTISGTATEDQKLTASHTITDEDGMPNSVSYQWKRGGSAISGATDVSYTLVQDDVGAAMTVTVSYTDDLGTSESKTSSATSAVANVNDPPGGPGVTLKLIDTVISNDISSSILEDASLNLVYDITDEDGISGNEFTYRWWRQGSNGNANAKVNATSTEYTLTHGDVDGYMYAVVSYVDNFGNSHDVSSALTPIVLNVDDSYSGTIEICGNLVEDETIYIINTLEDEDGINTASFQYQWKWGSDPVQRGDDKPIIGATSDTYTLVQAYVGKYIALDP
jgi:hypothetical protein